jgi:hypothetical protein
VVDSQGQTATGQSVHFASTHSGSDTLLDEVSFQLGDAGNNGQEQPAHCAIRGDVFPAADKFDPVVCKFVNKAEKMFGASSHSVESGDDDHCELPLPSILQHQVKAGTPSLTTRYAYIGVLRCDFKSALLCEFAEVIQLVVDALLWATDSGVNRTLLHQRFSFTLFCG